MSLRDRLRAQKRETVHESMTLYDIQWKEKWLQRDACRNRQPRKRKGESILVKNMATWIPKGVKYIVSLSLSVFTATSHWSPKLTSRAIIGWRYSSLDCCFLSLKNISIFLKGHILDRFNVPMHPEVVS